MQILLAGPVLDSVFAFDKKLEDAVNKRYIVVNAGSNPAPEEIQDFLSLPFALSYILNSVVCKKYFGLIYVSLVRIQLSCK